jgi:hypothetical protein
VIELTFNWNGRGRNGSWRLQPQPAENRALSPAGAIGNGTGLFPYAARAGVHHERDSRSAANPVGDASPTQFKSPNEFA